MTSNYWPVTSKKFALHLQTSGSRWKLEWHTWWLWAQWIRKINKCKFIFEAINHSKLNSRITGDGFDEIIYEYILKDINKSANVKYSIIKFK